MTKSQNGIKSISSPPSNILLEYKNHFWSRKSSSEIPARHGTTSISSLQIGRYSISNSIESTIRKYNTALQQHNIIFFTNRKSCRTRNASYKSWNDWESKTKYNQDYHCPSWSIFSLLDTLLRYMYLVRSSISLKRVVGVLHWKVSKTIIYLIRIVFVQQRSFISSFMNAKCVLRIRSMKVVKSSE